MKILVLSVILTYHAGHFTTTAAPMSNTQLKKELTYLAFDIKERLVNTKLVQRGRQFGFLLLGDKTKDYFESSTFNPIMISPKPVPDTVMNQYDNLLVALPSGGLHSEMILLQQLKTLYEMYTKRHTHQPQFILMYSNLMPCAVCTNLIIEEKDDDNFTGVDWFVMYHVGDSSNIPYVTSENTEHNKKKLRDKGIHVLQL